MAQNVRSVTVELAQEREVRTWPGLETAFASLPWYDLPEMQDANDALWSALRTELFSSGIEDVPERLDRTLPYGVDWNGSCLLTQTCGYPIFTTSFGQFSIVGTPCYDVPGCVGPLHRSFIVVRRDAAVEDLSDLRGASFAINEPDSNSGMNLPRRLFASLSNKGRFFSHVIVTGSHATSAGYVAEGNAKAAAIDCVTFALLSRYRPEISERLRVVAETPASPAPPLATSKRTPLQTVVALRAALKSILQSRKHAAIREALCLSGIADADESSYEVVLEYEREASALGYPVLA